MKNIIYILFLILSISVHGQKRSSCNSNYLYLISDSIPSIRYGYINSQKDTIIPLGKYKMCFTDTIKHLGIVKTKPENLITEIYIPIE
jgi:hypothetical protein